MGMFPICDFTDRKQDLRRHKPVQFQYWSCVNKTINFVSAIILIVQNRHDR